MSKVIGLSEPHIFGNEYTYIKECLDTGWVSSAGKFVPLFEKSIADYTGSKHVVACVNATSALHLSLRLLGVEANDEVIVPSLTFIAPINAIIYMGAEPVFMDSDAFCNINIEKTLEFLINETEIRDGYSFNKNTGKRVKAILPVHIFGNSVNLKELIIECKKRNIKILEDASESLGSFYIDNLKKQNHTGTLGDIGCISFNGNKILTTGGGGVILTSSQYIAEKASYLSQQAKDDPLNFVHNEVGYNYRLTNIQAAMGLAQMENVKEAVYRKKEIHDFYKERLNLIAGLSMLDSPPYSNSNNWLSVLKVDSSKFKRGAGEIIKRLNDNQIQARPIWRANHLQKPFQEFSSYKIENIDRIIKNHVCLPSGISLTKEDLGRVVSNI